MMKKLLLILIALPVIGFGQVYIPDANFKAYLVGNTAINTNGDTEIQVSEATVFNGTIFCQNLNISDLTGIEDFTSLNTLDCSYNQLTSLDLSQNTALTLLHCWSNQLTSLDVSGATALTTLSCPYNQLTTLDVSGATALIDLYCPSNQLTSLNVGGATDLTTLYCESNSLTILDVSQNTALTELSCNQNQISTLNLSNNNALTILKCQENNLISLDVSTNTALTILECNGNQLTSLDVSQNTALTSLSCSDNQLTSLDLRNGNNTNIPINSSYINLTNNPDLYCIDVDNIIYSTTNWTYNGWWASSIIDPWMSFSTDCSTALGCIDTLAYNYDSTATVNDGSCLTYVPDDNFEAYLETNGMGNGVPNDDCVLTQNISGLYFLNVAAQNISDLTGIQDFTNLLTLYCGANNLTELYLSSNTELTYLSCNGNNLDTLEISNNVSLEHLDCPDNNLMFLDVSNNILLDYLECDNNNLTLLDVSNLSVLLHLFVENNNLTSLDVSNNFYLSDLHCYNNNLNCIEVFDIGYAIQQQGCPWMPCYYKDVNAIWSLDCDAVVFGCTDSLACNYDGLATNNDNSCIYPVIWQQGFPICGGDSIIVGTSVYDATGSYIDTLTAGNGCDSIVYTNISIAPTSVWQWGTSICYGNIVMVGTSIYDTTGNYIDTLSTVNGCDSIVYTNLSIDEILFSFDTLSVNSSIVWNGMPLNVSGDYSIILVNPVGCDSIVNLNLTVTTTGILDIENNKNNLVKITDMLGQETPYRKNTPLFYIFDDGTVEKRIVIE